MSVTWPPVAPTNPKRRPAAAFSASRALSIPSNAEHSPGRATTPKGLTYPLGDYGPAESDLHMLAPGVGWARIALPVSLGHINIWALADRDAEGEGVPIVVPGWHSIGTGQAG